MTLGQPPHHLLLTFHNQNRLRTKVLVGKQGEGRLPDFSGCCFLRGGCLELEPLAEDQSPLEKEQAYPSPELESSEGQRAS